MLDRERDIGRCIEALLAQDHPSYEILVVDNGSTDGTREVVSRYPVKLLVEPRPNPYRARNLGIREARGEIIAFTDSDCAPEEGWLSALAACYEEETVGGVGGRLEPLPPSTTIEEFLAFGRLQIFDAAERREIRRDPGRFLSGAFGSANMSYRRRVLEELGGFDESFARFCGSYELCWRVQEAGYRVLHEPRARVRHRMRSSSKALARQFYEFGIGQIHLFRARAGRQARLQLKTYLFPPRELALPSPVPVWLHLDAAHGALAAVLLAGIFPWLLAAGLPLAVAVLGGAALGARDVVRRSGRYKWYLLYPALHLLRIGALTAGRVVGGLRHRVLAI